MNVEKLVSIITPCYNGEQYAARFFESILSQTYSNLELIFVNDGSTDQTEAIAESYRKRLEEKGIQYHYIYQKNAGQAAALNRGLAIFQGEYLMWSDSDDILWKNNVQKKVEFLEAHPEYGFVLCRGICVHESNLKEKVGDFWRIPPKGTDYFFRDLITEHNMIFTPGVYMVRRSVFEKAIPIRQIYVHPSGQNWQMLLPIAWNSSCGYLKDTLFSYVIREESHSHQDKEVESRLKKYRKHQELLTHVLKLMNIPNEEYYVKLAKEQCLRKQLDELYRCRDKKKLRMKYAEMKKMGCATKRDACICCSGCSRLVDAAYSLFKGGKKAIQNLKK